MGAGPPAAGGVAVTLVAAAAVASGTAVTGCTVTTVGCDALIASDVSGRAPELDSGVDPDVAGCFPDPESEVDAGVSAPPQLITSRVIKETAAIASRAPVRAFRLVLPAA